jgi:diguanylate cyclase (GGDEF)-like protein
MGTRLMQMRKLRVAVSWQSLIRRSRNGHRPRAVRFLNTLSLTISLAMLLLVVFGLWQARQDAWRAATVSSSNLVTALSRDIGNNVHLVDQAVIATSNGLALPNLWGYPANVRDLILFNKGRWSPYLNRIIVTDARGRVIAVSDRPGGADVDLSTRSYFRRLRASGSAEPVLSPVVISRLGNEPSLILARRITTANGRFGGIVAGEMPLRLIRPTIADVTIGNHSAINLFTLDGTIIVRNPVLSSGPMHNIGGTPTFERMKREISGSFVGRSAVDGEQRLYAFARPGRLPLLLDVATSTSEILTPWWKRSVPAILATVALCAAIIALTLLFQRELLRRERVEAELAELAATDGLTGLLNRRAFEAALEREWRRAGRTNRALSLAIIDADYFKGFNDRYGHVAGDKVLQAVAAAMRDVFRRSDDQIARIGGEEFAVLMPNTPADAAFNRAETLRNTIVELGIAHAGNAEGVVTISIGAASNAEGCSDSKMLTLAADSSLYRAKEDGRNRVIAA